MRVGIFMGGRSLEKEVSFNSGRTVYDHIDVGRYKPIPLFQTVDGDIFILPLQFLYRGKIADFEHRLVSQARKITWDELSTIIDFLYITTHGQYAEDGRLQGMLSLLNIPYLGAGVFASALRINKIMHKKILQAHGIAVPHYYALYSYELDTKAKIAFHVEKIIKQFDGPWVVKPACEGSSIGVSVAKMPDDLPKAIAAASRLHTTVQPVIVEKKVSGMEFSCVVLTDVKNNAKIPLMPTEILLEKEKELYDYEQKYMPGRALLHTPARCNQEVIAAIQDTCIKVMDVLEFNTIARIDGFVTQEGKIIIFDPNSLSGMGPSSFLFRQAACAGFSHTTLITHLIESEKSLWNIKRKS